MPSAMCVPDNNYIEAAICIAMWKAGHNRCAKQVVDGEFIAAIDHPLVVSIQAGICEPGRMEIRIPINFIMLLV